MKRLKEECDGPAPAETNGKTTNAATKRKRNKKGKDVEEPAAKKVAMDDDQPKVEEDEPVIKDEGGEGEGDDENSED